MQEVIYQNQYINIQRENSEIPWLKVFTNESYKELTQTPKGIRREVYRVAEVIEEVMIEYYAPKKINIASFGNYMPHVHMHVMARFEEDSFFPEPMWGKKQRDADLILPSFDGFIRLLLERL